MVSASLPAWNKPCRQSLRSDIYIVTDNTARVNRFLQTVLYLHDDPVPRPDPHLSMLVIIIVIVIRLLVSNAEQLQYFIPKGIALRDDVLFSVHLSGRLAGRAADQRMASYGWILLTIFFRESGETGAV